ncbi:Putative F-box-like domain superfamily protein [Septoria linicola]|uniref:F-box-like domain superfamily protein n=1 Tax=Septoria linicola TaxID=215465 RepID=A0A9Q9B5S4_9PEZI|nr:putative F-box-like domain superfamily protein [Septoria linicola]USW57666.1 Putative F-box-like domain superfamily protein [Septoria linicola]
MATNTASARVFGTAELIEMILLELPMQTLLVTAQRVCKDWNIAIASSTKLQQALFILPSTDDVLYWDWPLHLELDEVYEEAGKQCIFQHPLIQPRAPNLQYYPTIVYQTGPPGRPRANKTGKPSVMQWPNILYRTEASWRKQLATQPPIRQLIHIWDVLDAEQDDRVIASGAYLTLGDIADRFGTLDIGKVQGGQCWQEISWRYDSTYSTIAQAKKAVYVLPWCVESHDEEVNDQESEEGEEVQDQD